MTQDDEFWLPTREPHFAACLDHLFFEWWVGDRQLTIYCNEEDVQWIAANGADIDIDMAEGDGRGFVTAYRWLLEGGDIKEMEQRAAPQQPAPAEGDSDDNERFIANIDDKGAIMTAPADRPADGDGARGGT